MVERFRAGNFCRSVDHVSGFVDDYGHVAGANTDRRSSARIGGLDIGLRAGGDDEIGLAHQLEGLVTTDRCGQLQHEIAWCADAIKFGMRILQEQRQRRLTLWRWRQDNRVAAFQRIEDVIGRRCTRIGRRRNGGDYADWTCNLDQAALMILADDANRFRTVEIPHQPERLAMILGDLVRDIAKAGVTHRQFSQRTVA